jgi:hypothetical protein
MPPLNAVFKLRQARNRNETFRKSDPDGAKRQAKQAERKQRERIHTDPDYNARYNALARGRLNRKRLASGRELVPCLESPCCELGYQFEWLDPHLSSMHNMYWRQYQRKHPGALRGPHKQLEARGAGMATMQRKYAERLSGGRPSDWWERPIEYRIIGEILLSCDHWMRNQELGKILDGSRLIKCPYGDTWEAVLSSDAATKDPAATGFVMRIRKWVNKPGKPGNPGRSITAVNHDSAIQ